MGLLVRFGLWIGSCLHFRFRSTPRASHSWTQAEAAADTWTSTSHGEYRSGRDRLEIHKAWNWPPIISHLQPTGQSKSHGQAQSWRLGIMPCPWCSSKESEYLLTNNAISQWVQPQNLRRVKESSFSSTQSLIHQSPVSLPSHPLPGFTGC